MIKCAGRVLEREKGRLLVRGQGRLSRWNKELARSGRCGRKAKRGKEKMQHFLRQAWGQLLLTCLYGSVL